MSAHTPLDRDWEEASSTERTVAALAGVLNENDDPRKVLSWLLGGKLDAKHMIRVLPHTVNDLRALYDDQQRVDEQGAAVVDEFRRVLYRSLLVTVRNSSLIPFEGTVTEWIAHRLTRIALPEFWCRNEQQREWLAQTHKDFFRELDTKFENSGLEDYGDIFFRLDDVAPPIHDMLCETCRNWAPRVDEMLFEDHRGGTFLFRCREVHSFGTSEFFKAMIGAFAGDILDKNYKAQCKNRALRRNHVIDSTMVVLLGSCETHKSCWVCDSPPPSQGGFPLCPTCKVTRYCGRECQKLAWEGGHKHRCADLKKHSELYTESLGAIELAHATGGMLEGEQLSLTSDYQFACNLIGAPYPYPTLPLPDGSVAQDHLPPIPGPSMKYFYKNLGVVLRGEWWFYSDSVSMEEYAANLNGWEATTPNCIHTRWTQRHARCDHALL